MSTTMSRDIPSQPRATTAAFAGPAYSAYRILQIAFAAVPIAAGLDKFAHVLVDWNQYLSPEFARLVPWNAERIMMGVGVVEVLAGLLVAFAPRVGGFLVAVWLWAIIVNLLLMRGYYDIALRDFGLSLGALALGFLGREFHGVARRNREVR